jgi:hypothetical protein
MTWIFRINLLSIALDSENAPRFGPQSEATSVDELNIDAPVLGRLGRVGDFHELARGGIGISEAVRFDEFSWGRAEMGNVDRALL